MNARYLIDTDWAIHYLNGHPAITARLGELTGEGVGLSIISLGELFEGVYGSTDPRESEHALDAFLRGVEVIGVDVETSQLFGRERRRRGPSEK